MAGRLLVHVQLDLVTIGIADTERGGRLAEGHEPVLLHPASSRGQIGQRAADVERDVVETGHALGLRPGTVGALQLAGDVVMVHPGGKKDDTPCLAGSRLREAEDVAVEAPGGAQIVDEE